MPQTSLTTPPLWGHCPQSSSPSQTRPLRIRQGPFGLPLTWLPPDGACNGLRLLSSWCSELWLSQCLWGLHGLWKSPVQLPRRVRKKLPYEERRADGGAEHLGQATQSFWASVMFTEHQ